MIFFFNIIGFSNNGVRVICQGVRGDNSSIEFVVDKVNFVGIFAKITFDVFPLSRTIP